MPTQHASNGTSIGCIPWFGHVFIAFLLASLVVATRVDAAPDSPDSASAPATTTMKEMRRKAAERRRRLILNNDGGDAVKQLSQPTAEELLQQRTTKLVGTQIDTICYATRGVGLDSFTHFTKIGTVFTVRKGQHYANNKMESLVAKGIDPLRVMTRFGKERGIEVFWSLRMNDTHDASREEYGPISLQANRFKSAHPEFMLGTASKRPKHGAWTALDYGRPEVRERAFQLVEEVCRNYDVDGVELDFFRHPVFFRATSQGQRVTDNDRAAMTTLMRRIRALADEVGQSRGRPILIAVRIPDSVEYCQEIGLELERWMAADLFDMFVPSSYFRLNEWDYSVKLGHKYGVKVYPSLDEPRIKADAAREMRRTDLAYRARAADAWRAGADGVYLFNFPDLYESDNPLLNELGSPQGLAKLDKDYFGSVMGVAKAAGGNLPYESYMRVETLNPEKPKKVAPERPWQQTFQSLKIRRILPKSDRRPP